MTPSAHPFARRLISLVGKTPFRRYLTAYPRLHAGTADVRVPIRAGLGTTNLDLSEPWMFELLRRLLGVQTGTFVDVGVNMGQTLLKVLLLDPTRRYVGFEPNPLCVYYADLIIRANDAKQATLVPCGLSDRCGPVKLFGIDSYDSSASIVDGFRDPAYYHVASHVMVAPGDEALAAVGDEPIGIVKIDVEGGELEVLRGLHGTLARHQPLVVCEILPTYDENTEGGRMRRTRVDASVGLMHELGYVMGRISHDGSVALLDHIEAHGDLDRCEYRSSLASAAVSSAA